MKTSTPGLRRLSVFASTLLLLVSLCAAFPAASVSADDENRVRPLCDDNAPLCTEVVDSIGYEGGYTGHDEPSVLFYSNTPGSGNSNHYQLTLPNDPPTLPTQDGKGGTFNFQLHPAFWFGMALCDSESYPEYTKTCTPDSDANIFDNSDKTAADYIGHHPGTAFMEMQFYPPGWIPWPAGASCDATKWCAALNIDSFSESLTQVNNPDCLAIAGIEPVNFAFITRNGVPHAPANPVNSTLATFTPDSATDLLMNSGDKLAVDLHDTAHGFQVVINDLTTGQSGSMTASAANSFGQVKFDPTGTGCQNIPYDFHPMYSTSSEHTRVPWAAHSYNVAFSDEIGHFEYCDNVSEPGGSCLSGGATNPTGPDSDDVGCFAASSSTRIQVSGCFGTDSDFDGPAYQLTWPGTFTNPGLDRTYHPTSVLFSSPLFSPTGGGAKNLQNYSRIAFETDLPRIEAPDSGGICNRTTGANCTNPPPGANFYPIYTTRGGIAGDKCLWQLGGTHIPGTKDTFGGNSTAEYGPLLLLTYPSANAAGFSQRFNDFRQVLNFNPCRARAGDD